MQDDFWKDSAVWGVLVLATMPVWLLTLLYFIQN